MWCQCRLDNHGDLIVEYIHNRLVRIHDLDVLSHCFPGNVARLGFDLVAQQLEAHSAHGAEVRRQLRHGNDDNG